MQWSLVSNLMATVNHTAEEAAKREKIEQHDRQHMTALMNTMSSALDDERQG